SPPTRDNSTTLPCRGGCTLRGSGASLASDKMCLGPVVVVDVRRQDPPQMPLADHHDVVNAFASNRRQSPARHTRFATANREQCSHFELVCVVTFGLLWLSLGPTSWVIPG